MEAHFRAKYPKSPEDSDGVYKSVIRAKALDTLRGLLPAATTSNVGLFGTGQAFEALLLRMFAHPLEEVRGCAQQMLAELRQVIPAFLARVDQPDRGGRWIEYFADTPRAFDGVAAAVRRRHRRPSRATRSRSPTSIPTARSRSSPRRSMPRRRCPTTSCSPIARRMSADDRAALLRAYVGDARQPPPQARPRVRAHAATASTSSPTTARSAICSAIAC